MRSKASIFSAVPVTSTPDEYRALMQGEFDKWKKVVTKGKITLE